MILQNGKGQVLMAALKWIPSIDCATLGEALAVLIGLRLVMETGFSNVEVETDNIQVAFALQKATPILMILV